MAQAAKILFIDDEERFLDEKRRALAGGHYEIFTTTDAEKAFSLLAEHDFSVIISDLRMSPLSGTEVLARAAQISPDCIRIILAGHHRLEEVFETINAGHVWKYIQKPIHNSDLKNSISQAVAQWRLVKDNREMKEQLQKHNLRLEALVAERTRELTARDKVMEYLLKAGNLTEALDTISKSIADAWGIEFIAVHLFIGGSLQTKSVWGGGEETSANLKFWLCDEADPACRAFASHENLRPAVEDLSAGRREFFNSAQPLFLAMRKDKECLGVIEIANPRTKLPVDETAEERITTFIKFYNLAAKDHLLQSNLKEIESRLDEIIQELV